LDSLSLGASSREKIASDEMAENPEYREACRRQHRLIGNYLAVEAWCRGLDCIVLNRLHLETLFGLTRLTKARIGWIREDLQPWFPYSAEYGWGRSRSPSWSTATLFLSRSPIKEHLPTGKMSDEDRIKRMAAGSPRTALFTRGKSKIPDDAEMVSRLARFAAGLDAPALPRPRR
jgi:hypothetical protein